MFFGREASILSEKCSFISDGGIQGRMEFQHLSRIHYQIRLGAPWFDLLGTPIYHPWRLFE